MQTFFRRGRWACLLVLPALVGSAFANDASSSEQTAADQVARLEALLKAQQDQITALQQQVSTARTQDEDRERVEVLRAQIRAILDEEGFRENLAPSMLQAGYDDGFFIRSSDNNFLMKFNALMQMRWTHYGTRSENRWLSPRTNRSDYTGFDLQRARLRISGHAYDEDLTYLLELRADAADTWDAVVQYAWLNYAFSDEFQIRAGVFRLASTRSQMTYEGNLKFVDRPMFDAVYGLGIGMGVRFWGRLFDDKLDWYVDIVDALGDGGLQSAVNRTITTDPAEKDGTPAGIAKLVWHVLGDERVHEDFVMGPDELIRENPTWDIGIHYAYNHDRSDARTTRIPVPNNSFFRPGGFRLVPTNGLDIHQVGVDTEFHWEGFSATAEYVMRAVNVQESYAPWLLATGSSGSEHQHGAYAQVGYFLPIPGLENKIEAVARVGGICANAGQHEGSWEYAAGLNYYIDGHRIKLQTDLTKIEEVPTVSNWHSLANVNDDVLMWRVQLQLAF